MLLCEVIGALDELKVELFEASLGQFTAVSRHVLVALADHEQTGHVTRRSRQWWIGEEEFGGGSVVVDRPSHSSFLREDILVDLKVIGRGMLHDLEDLEVVEAGCELRKERHLEVEDVPRHQELLEPAGDELVPDLARRTPDHHILVERLHMLANITEADYCSPVMSDECELLATC